MGLVFLVQLAREGGFPRAIGLSFYDKRTCPGLNMKDANIQDIDQIQFYIWRIRLGQIQNN